MTQRSLWRGWLYVCEGCELAAFMVSACWFTVVLYGRGGWGLRHLPDTDVRRLLMGVAMGVTAVLIIRSPLGKLSGAHFNPAITLTYLRLGKIGGRDALGYVAGQFAGGIAGVGLAALWLGRRLSAPEVDYAVTVPGRYGVAAAWGAEFFMGLLLMGVVLWLSNRPRLAGWTSFCVGLLIVGYVYLFAPVSGFSINPARTVGSAVFAQVWTALWVYFTAPAAGMLLAAEVYVRSEGQDRILCAKLHPSREYACPFHCSFPGHRQIAAE